MPKGYPLQPSELLVDRTGGALAVVTINRYARRNSMSLAMWRGLQRIIDELSADAGVRAIVITGAGGAFCAGADISEFHLVRATPEDGHAYEAAVGGCQMAIAQSPKAVIAAISGPAYGGGVGLALSCDFRVADQSASFAIPAARLSNVYGVIETRALYEAVGLAAAKEVLFTGRRYDAGEAVRIGLATHMAEGTALDGARKLAEGMRSSAPLTIKGTKIVLSAIAHGEVEQQAAAINAVQSAALSSADYKEGVAAFAAKRDPVFRGE